MGRGGVTCQNPLALLLLHVGQNCQRVLDRMSQLQSAAGAAPDLGQAGCRAVWVRDRLATPSPPPWLRLRKIRLHGARQVGPALFPMSLLGCPRPKLLAREQAFPVLVVPSFICNYWKFLVTSPSLASSSGYTIQKRNPREHCCAVPQILRSQAGGLLLSIFRILL